MKKKLVCTCVLIMILILPGCSISSNPESQDFHFGEDDQYFYVIRNSFGPGGFAESENGYYFFSGPSNQYLYYMDKKTMKPVVLCNKPDCLHGDEPDGKKLLQCNAFFEENGNLVYYNNNLYVMGDAAGGPTLVQSLYKISLDGTKREKVLTFKEEIHQVIIHRGYIYYSTDDSGTIQGKEESTSTKCCIYRVKLDNVNKEPELLYTVRGVYERVIQLIGYRNAVFFHSLGMNTAADQFVSNEIYKYDILNHNITKIKDNLGFFTLYKDQCIYIDPDYNMFTDAITETAPKPVNTKGVPVNMDDQYIYAQNWVEDKGTNFAIYTHSGELIKDFGYLGNNLTVYGGNEKYIFIYGDGERKNEFGNIQALYIVDKSKIGNGGASLEKIFEYEPKVNTPGVIIPAS